MPIQQTIAQNTILQGITSNFALGKIVSVDITSPSGSGKSWLLNTLALEITEKGGCVMQLQGDELRAREWYYPLDRFIEQKHKQSTRVEKAAKKLVSEIPYAGHALETLLEGVSATSPTKQKTDISFELNKHQAFTNHILSVLHKYPILALLCDDFQDFDTATVNHLINLFAYLNTLHFDTCILLVTAVNNERLNPQSTVRWLSSFHYSYTLNRVTRQQLPTVLFDFGLKHTLTESDFDLIYTSSGGHLHILKIVAAYLNKNREQSLQGEGKNLIYTLFENQLKQLNNFSHLVRALLHTLSHVGQSGSKAELLCLLEKKDETLEAIGYAEQLDMVTVKDGYLHFSHELIKDFITTEQSKQKPSFYTKFAGCLRSLNPGNYLRRAWAEDKAGNLQKADVFTTLFVLQRLRLGHGEEFFEESNQLKSEIADLCKEAIGIFGVASRLNAQSQLSEALLALAAWPAYLPSELMAEQVYLECEILLKKTDYASRREALNKLEAWDVLKEEEPEQWYRLAQLKLLAHAELGNFEAAIKTEQEIGIYFSKRVAYDAGAQDILNRLNLYSEMLYSPEIANGKLERTARQLKQQLDNENFDRLVDYYIALCNLSGNCFTIGKLKPGIEYAQKALELITEYPYISFSHKEAVFNNLLLCSYFEGSTEPAAIISAYKHLATGDFEEDPVLLNSNYAGILALNERVPEAIEVLKARDAKVAEGSTDVFYLYYHKFNRALLEFLNGNIFEAREELKYLQRFENDISPKLSSFYKKHRELTLTLMEENKVSNLAQLQEQFKARLPVYLGLAWNRFKSVYLFTDLQIWTNN